MKKNTNKKTVAKKVKATVASVTPTPVATPVATPTPAVKRGRGRPDGSTSLSLVSLASLVNALPANSQLPISNRIVRSLNSLGFKIASTPFKASGIAEITNVYKKSVPTSVVAVDLNKEAVV
jgi:hypothetical protein